MRMARACTCTQVRRVVIAPADGSLFDQQLSSVGVQCAHSLNESAWANATSIYPSFHTGGGGSGGGGSGAFANTNLSVSLDECDARYVRLTLLSTFGSTALSPRATVKSVRLYGMATPSPPPPPVPPTAPPPLPSLPIWEQDYVAVEAERLRCVDRELFAIARTKVAISAASHTHPARAPHARCAQIPGCAPAAR